LLLDDVRLESQSPRECAYLGNKVAAVISYKKNTDSKGRDFHDYFAEVYDLRAKEIVAYLSLSKG